MEWARGRKYLVPIAASAIVVLLIGLTGSIAALASMLFPSGTLSEGLAQDFSPTSHMLLRLRLFHPITAILGSVSLIFLTGWMVKTTEGKREVARWANVMSILLLAQLAFGSLTLYMMAPIVMQLGHLFLADAIWISLVLFSAAFLSIEDTPT
jgi:heme A synthase